MLLWSSTSAVQCLKLKAEHAAIVFCVCYESVSVVFRVCLKSDFGKVKLFPTNKPVEPSFAECSSVILMPNYNFCNLDVFFLNWNFHQSVKKDAVSAFVLPEEVGGEEWAEGRRGEPSYVSVAVSHQDPVFPSAPPPRLPQFNVPPVGIGSMMMMIIGDDDHWWR